MQISIKTEVFLSNGFQYIVLYVSYVYLFLFIVVVRTKEDVELKIMLDTELKEVKEKLLDLECQVI